MTTSTDVVLRRLAFYVATHPERLDQRVLIRSHAGIHKGNLLGIVVERNVPLREWHAFLSLRPAARERAIVAASERILGKYSCLSQLRGSSELWPYAFGAMYRKAETSKQKAMIASAFIDWTILRLHAEQGQLTTLEQKIYADIPRSHGTPEEEGQFND